MIRAGGFRLDAERNEPPGEPRRSALLQVVAWRRAVIDLEIRQEHFADVDFERAAPRNLDRVRHGLGQIGEQSLHLGRRLQVLLFAVRSLPCGIVERDALRDADARLVRLEVAATQETDLVRRNHGHALRGRELHGTREILVLAGPPEPLQLDVEAPRQQLVPALEHLGGARAAPTPERLAELAVLRAEPLFQQHVTAGHETQHGALRQQRREPFEARAVLAQQRAACRVAILARLGKPHVGADDRLHAALERELVELHERRDVGLVGDRARRHALFGRGVDERVDADDAIDERVFRVDPQVDETAHRSCPPPLSRTGANDTR